jgi:hypothetical protein
VAIEIEFAFMRLVPIPGNTQLNRVETEFLVAVELMFPKIACNLNVTELRGMNKKRLAAEAQLGIAI